MSAMIRIPVGPRMPLIAAVEAMGKRAVKVTWRESMRPQREEVIDLSPLIDCFRFYRGLRANQELFLSVHVVDEGNAIAWGDDDSIDMSATAIENVADEAMTAREFREFISRNGLTHAGAAVILGYSRRQIESYLAGERIPRVVALACYGFEAKRLRSNLGWSSRGTGNEFGTVIQPTSTSFAPIQVQNLAAASPITA